MSKKGWITIAIIVLIIGGVLACCIASCVLTLYAIPSSDLSSAYETQTTVLSSGGSDKIAVINVEGIIMDVAAESDIWGSAYASSPIICDYLNEAINDDEVKAVILSIDSPGGDVYASDIIYNKIKEVQQSGKVVVVHMKGVAASGGYYIAAPADAIVASPLTITGSVGVYMQFQSMDGLYEKLGIETRTITNAEGEYKTGAGLFDDNPNGEEDKLYQEIVDETFDKFVSVIEDGRELNRTEILEFADGRVMTGQQAKELNLVDELGEFEQAVQTAEDLAGISGATIFEYESYDFWSMLAGYTAGIINPAAPLVQSLDIQPGPRLMYLYDGQGIQ